MSTPPGLARRVARIAERVAKLGSDAAPSLVWVMIGADRRDDPRIAPLVAAARAEGCIIVRPWSENEAGELVDWSAPDFARAMCERADAEATEQGDIKPTWR